MAPAMDADHVLALLAARIPELSDADRAEIEAAISGRAPPVLLDQDTARRLMAVIDAIQQRLDEMTAALAERAMAQEAQERENAFVDAAASEVVWN